MREIHVPVAVWAISTVLNSGTDLPVVVLADEEGINFVTLVVITTSKLGRFKAGSKYAVAELLRLPLFTALNM